ncbi:MAG: NAD(P)-dependent oxidoreductase [Verrucomicrobia bacterium]|nr:NAD(P)-dependent oxidoreductase [Verrucomicrobiota bacterium]
MNQTALPGSTPLAQETIGLIGVGLLGTALAERLLGGGFGVAGWDVDPARRAALAELGGQAAANAVEVVSRCRRVVLSLPTAEVVAAVLEGVRGYLLPGQVMVDTTTGGPDAAEAAGARLAGRGVAYLDATVSGSSAQARAGEVSVMVGGSREAFARCEDLLRCFARETFYLGPCGSGARMKLVSNLVLGLNRAALAEGLALARALGLELSQVLTVLRSSMAYSRIMDTKGEKMVRGDFAPQGRLSQHLKDVRLILEAGAQARLELPLSAAHRELLERVEAAGAGALDNSAILRAYESKPDCEPAGSS